MGKSGGARQGSGRKPSSLNRRSVELIAEALASGDTPAHYLLKIMRDENTDEKRRDWAAEKLAPYVHPRPAPLERCVEIDLPATNTVEGIDSALDALVQAMARGELSPSEGQHFMSVIETRRKAIETGHVLVRLAELEALVQKIHASRA